MRYILHVARMLNSQDTNNFDLYHFVPQSVAFMNIRVTKLGESKILYFGLLIGVKFDLMIKPANVKILRPF